MHIVVHNLLLNLTYLGYLHSFPLLILFIVPFISLVSPILNLVLEMLYQFFFRLLAEICFYFLQELLQRCLSWLNNLFFSLFGGLLSILLGWPLPFFFLISYYLDILLAYLTWLILLGFDWFRDLFGNICFRLSFLGLFFDFTTLLFANECMSLLFGCYNHYFILLASFLLCLLYLSIIFYYLFIINRDQLILFTLFFPFFLIIAFLSLFYLLYLLSCYLLRLCFILLGLGQYLLLNFIILFFFLFMLLFLFFLHILLLYFFTLACIIKSNYFYFILFFIFYRAFIPLYFLRRHIFLNLLDLFLQCLRS